MSNVNNNAENHSAKSGGNTPKIVSNSNNPVPYVTLSFFKIIARARGIFGKQIDQSIECKRSCVEKVLLEQTKSSSYTPTYFWRDCKDNILSLLDSKRYCAECAELNVDSFAISTHIVFEGKKVMERVLKRGIANVFGDKLKDFTTPIIDKETLDKLSM